MIVLSNAAEQGLYERLGDVEASASFFVVCLPEVQPQPGRLRFEILKDLPSALIFPDADEMYLTETGELYWLTTLDAASRDQTFLPQISKALYKDALALRNLKTFSLPQEADTFRQFLLERHRARIDVGQDFVAQMKRMVVKIGGDVFKQGFEKRKTREDFQILLLEDEPFSRNLFTKALEKNFRIITATNSRQAMEKYLLNVPDIVFLDIQLPDVSGLDILRYIQLMDPDPYVVMLTSQSSGEAIERAMKQGAKGYILKPFNKGKMVNYILRCAEARGKKLNYQP